MKEAQEMMLSKEDLAWLIRFAETAEDDESFDVPKSPLRRLVEIGAVRHCGGGRYAMTSFGDWAVDSHFGQQPSLPLAP